MGRTRYVDTGVIYCDDNLDRLRQMEAESADLIYLDPPFFSNRQYEVIWGDEAEVRSFEDRWKGGINHYIDWMKPRLAEMHRVLKSTGSIYLHCDWHASHHLKVAMDHFSLFGQQNFLNDIVWNYATGGAGKRAYARKHDTILFYSKGPDYKFYPERVREARTEKAMHRARNPKGARIAATNDTKLPTDVWQIPALNPMARERLGYPTQKPEELLAKIILASSDIDDVVLDPFCGCGTTVAVAQQMQRRWIGIDISLTAAEVMKARVESMGATKVSIKGEPKSKDDLQKLMPFEFQNYIIRRVVGTNAPRKSGDMGIDGFSYLEFLPIQVKRSESVGRPVVDSFETAVERYGAKKGYIVGLSFTSGAYEEVARVKNDKGLEIELIEAEDIRTGASKLVPPLTGRREVLDLPETRPIPQAPPKEARATVEELDKSVKTAGEAA